MSKVAIQGNASGTGTFTIQSPATNTDRVLTLPDEAGTVLTSGTPLSSFPTGFANGITHMTQFRLTASYDPGADADITANLEEVDDSTYSRIGTAVSESSGIFTLPAEGLWQVIAIGVIASDVDNNFGIAINVSSDSGSNYSPVARAYGGQNSGTLGADSVSTSVYINCTNASTFRVKFATFSFGNSATLMYGDTSANQTHFTFMRIGDAQ